MWIPGELGSWGSPQTNLLPNEAPQVNRRIAQQARKAQSRIRSRLARARRRQDSGKPVLSQTHVTYEMSERVSAMSHGGLAAAHQVVVRSGLVRGSTNASICSAAIGPTTSRTTS